MFLALQYMDMGFAILQELLFLEQIAVQIPQRMLVPTMSKPTQNSMVNVLKSVIEVMEIFGGDLCPQ